MDAGEAVLLQVLKVNIQISILLHGHTTGVYEYKPLQEESSAATSHCLHDPPSMGS